MRLSNGILSIEVARHGAELVSLKKGERELLWSGDAAFWNRHAPILFPAVGKPYESTVRIDGKAYTIKQHGFARDCEFEEKKNSGNGSFLAKLRRSAEPCPGLRVTGYGSKVGEQEYPYQYDLEAEYKLEGNTLIVTWTVTNRDAKTMHFQIGAHPGFMLPDYDAADEVHGYLRYYDKAGRPVSPTIVSMLDGGNRVPLDTPRIIPAEMEIRNETFAGDALMFEEGQVMTAELLDKQKKPVLKVRCDQAEAYGIWAPKKEHCPFVCLEPWCGICDPKGFTGDISERPYAHHLAPGEQFAFRYEVEVLYSIKN